MYSEDVSFDTGKILGLMREPNATYSQAFEFFRDQCKRNGGNISLESLVVVGAEQFKKCLEGALDIVYLKEIKKAFLGNKNVDLTSLCTKKQDVQKCVANFTASTVPCWPEKEKVNEHYASDMVKAFLDFVCFNDGRPFEGE